MLKTFKITTQTSIEGYSECIYTIKATSEKEARCLFEESDAEDGETIEFISQETVSTEEFNDTIITEIEEITKS